MLPNFYIRGGRDIEKTNTDGWACYNADGCRDIYNAHVTMPVKIDAISSLYFQSLFILPYTKPQWLKDSK